MQHVYIRQSICHVFNQIMVYRYGFLFDWTTMCQTADSITPLTWGEDVASKINMGGVLVSCFVGQNFVSFLVLQTSHRVRELVALLLWYSECHVSVIVLCLILTVPLVGLWFVIVAFSGHSHLLF